MASQPALRKRKVFYVMGFDPRGPAFYHAMLRREGRLSGKRGFGQFEAGPLSQSWAHGDSCTCRSGTAPELEIEYEFLSISDIIAHYFRANLLWYLWAGLKVLAIMVFTGFQARNLRHAPRFGLFTLYPFVLLAALALVATALAVLMASLLSPAAGWPILAVLIFYALCHVLRRFDHRSYVFYLIGDFSFSHSAVTYREPALQVRMEAFAERVAATLQASSPDEEVLIVGHSSGGLLAIQLAAAAARQVSPEQAARISLLTLGNQASLGLCQDTQGFVADVASVAAQVSWRDIFAPQDVISSGRFDPAEKLVPGAPRQALKLVSARFSEVFEPASYARIKHSFFKLHMQYLRASETGRGFNYFAVLGSPRRLAETLT